MKTAPKFITFEGGEGSGKTTQIHLLAEHLRQVDIRVVTTREPGGTLSAEAIRRLVLDHKAEGLSPLAETLLFLAARVEHVEHLISPALEEDNMVLCDRFIDSTLVYQGIARGLGVERIKAIHHTILPEPKPDLTFLLDIEPLEGLKRAVARSDEPTRFDAMNLAFHEQVREGFLSLAKAEPKRFKIIDAAQPKEKVFKQILAHCTFLR